MRHFFTISIIVLLCTGALSACGVGGKLYRENTPSSTQE